MDKHTIAELAYKNGYEKGSKETAEKICTWLDEMGGDGSLFAGEIRKHFGI